MIEEKRLSSWLWRDYIEIDSTNNLAKAQSLSFDGRPVVFTAVTQTSGRGRLDRRWISAPGNLFMSQLFHASLPISYLVFITAVGIVKTIEELTTDLDIAIKWPNDILISGAKICGILIESAENQTVVIGSGVNLVSSPVDGQLLYPATNLSSLGFNITRETFLTTYLHHFDTLINICQTKGFSTIRDIWLQYAYHLNRPLKINYGNKIIEGVFKGIDEEGFLLLKQEQTIIRVTAGDVLT